MSSPRLEISTKNSESTPLCSSRCGNFLLETGGLVCIHKHRSAILRPFGKQPEHAPHFTMRAGPRPPQTKVGTGEQGEVRPANSAPRGKSHLKLGRVRLQAWYEIDFQTAESLTSMGHPIYLYINMYFTTNATFSICYSISKQCEEGYSNIPLTQISQNFRKKKDRPHPQYTNVHTKHTPCSILTLYPRCQSA